MGDLFSQMIKTTGDAERESGEPITWGEVDYDKLRSSRISNPSVTSWDAPNRDDNANIKVNDSKGGVGGMIFPSTCLLYTSPSPRDLSTSRMPSSA